MRSTKENARKWGSVFSVQYSESRSNASTLHTLQRLHGSHCRSGGRSGGALLADHHLAEGLCREQARNISDFQWGLDTVGRHFTQERFQPRQPSLGYRAALIKFGFRKIAPRFLDDFAARNLHFEA